MEAVRNIRNQQIKSLKNSDDSKKRDICTNNIGPFRLTSSNPAQSLQDLYQSSEVHVHIGSKPYFWVTHRAKTYLKDCPPYKQFTDAVCQDVCARLACTPKLRTTYDLRLQ